MYASTLKDMQIAMSLVEEDPASIQKLIAFWERVLREHVVMFKITEELRIGIRATLSKIRHD